MNAQNDPTKDSGRGTAADLLRSRFGSPNVDMPAGARRAGQAAPMTGYVPQFGWTPQYADFPLSFPGAPSPSAAMTAPTRAVASAGRVSSAPRRMDWAKILPAAALALAIAAFGYVMLMDRGGGDSDTPVIGGANATQTAPSILSTQRPGDGGADSTVTTGAASATQQPAGATSTAQTRATATAETAAEAQATLPPVEALGIIQVSAAEGETLIDIAQTWGLEVSTLVWANDIEDPGQPLPAGTLVTIPPWDGVIHTVAAGENLESIAALYSVTPGDIVSIIQNGVKTDEDLHAGMRITVPNAAPAVRGGMATYTVKDGDNINVIAGYYGLNPQTIATANDLPSDFLIYPGQQLNIPPADGILYWVVAGDTVESIASAFGVPAAMIRNFAFNNVPGTSQPTPGQPIMIPGEDTVSDASKNGGTGDTVPSSDPFAGAPEAMPEYGVATGQFIWPAVGELTTLFTSTHNGLDIANAAWAPIVAADGGKVTFAGWNENGLGYAVAIDHGNGYVTWYGHMAQTPSVAKGELVARGEWLGPMGSTGKSTGPHLHFVVLEQGVYLDPLAVLP